LAREKDMADIQLGFRFEEENGSYDIYKQIPEETRHKIECMYAKLITNSAKIVLSNKKEHPQHVNVRK
jgi:hypothetical protein